MHAGHYSSLLPGVFRLKTSRVHVFQPQVILLDFHGTISEKRWEDKVIFPYVRKSVGSYLRENTSNELVQKCLPGLKNESFEQRFRHKYEDAPIIDDQTSENEEIDPIKLADQMSDFLHWQMSNRRETRETQIIERLVWLDGYRRHLITTPIYDDVMTCVKRWREQHNCSIHVISSIDGDTLKLLLENTDKGNLHQYLSGYVSAKKTGDKLISDTYQQFYEKLPQVRQPTKTPSPQASNKIPPLAQVGQSVAIKSAASNDSVNSGKSATKSAGPNDISASSSRPVLFLTDSGQEAKAASQVAGGSAFECLLVNRPGNKKFRTYYLSHFQYVDKFDDIEFV